MKIRLEKFWEAGYADSLFISPICLFTHVPFLSKEWGGMGGA